MTITSGLRYFINKASTSCCMMKNIRLSNTTRASTTTVKALFSTNKGEKMKTHVLSSTFIENNNVHMCNDNYYYNYHQTRHLGRKAGRMGKHLETLNEIAHRDEHEKAKERRNKHKKQGKGVQNNVNSPTNEIPPMEEDETETIFDHGGNDDNDDGGDDNTPSLPDINDVRTRMMKVVDTMEVSFKAIRGAEATPELFDSVQVKAYGTMTPLNGIGQVVINSPTRATITCFDPEVAPAVRDAVRDMTGMNFNPMVEDGVVIVPIPRVSAETRKALVKQLGTTAENTRQRIRRIRRGAQDVVKKAKDGKLEGISEDDAFRVGKEIDSVTEECIRCLNDIVDKKQASVMNV